MLQDGWTWMSFKKDIMLSEKDQSQKKRIRYGSIYMKGPEEANL